MFPRLQKAWSDEIDSRLRKADNPQGPKKRATGSVAKRSHHKKRKIAGESSSDEQENDEASEAIVRKVSLEASLPAREGSLQERLTPEATAEPVHPEPQFSTRSAMLKSMPLDPDRVRTFPYQMVQLTMSLTASERFKLNFQPGRSWLLNYHRSLMLSPAAPYLSSNQKPKWDKPLSFLFAHTFYRRSRKITGLPFAFTVSRYRTNFGKKVQLS